MIFIWVSQRGIQTQNLLVACMKQGYVKVEHQKSQGKIQEFGYPYVKIETCYHGLHMIRLSEVLSHQRHLIITSARGNN